MKDVKIELLIEDGWVWCLVETGPCETWERYAKIEDLPPILKDYVIDTIEYEQMMAKEQ